jgi:hypothetical protein
MISVITIVAECPICFIVMLSVLMLSVTMLNVIMLSVIMLNVVAPFFFSLVLNAAAADDDFLFLQSLSNFASLWSTYKRIK